MSRYKFILGYYARHLSINLATEQNLRGRNKAKNLSADTSSAEKMVS